MREFHKILSERPSTLWKMPVMVEHQKTGGEVTQSSQVRALLAKGMSTAEIVKEVGCKPGLVYVIRSKQGGSAKRSAGRKTASAGTTGGLSGILEAVQNSERERQMLRKAIEKIRMVCAEAMSN